jgi:hypothetical protein
MRGAPPDAAGRRRFGAECPTPWHEDPVQVARQRQKRRVHRAARLLLLPSTEKERSRQTS